MPLVYVEGDDPARWTEPDGDMPDLDAECVGADVLGTNRGMWGSASNETFAAVMNRMIRRVEALQNIERTGASQAGGRLACVMGSFESDFAEASAAAKHGLLTQDELDTAGRYAAWFGEHVCPGPAGVVVIKAPTDPANFTPDVSACAALRAERDSSRMHVMVEEAWSEDSPHRVSAFLTVLKTLTGTEDFVRCGLALTASGAAATPKSDA